MRSRFFSSCLRAFVAIFGLLVMEVNAQSSQDIFIKAFVAHDSIMLRWTPENLQTWKDGIKNGYTIERFTTDDYFDSKDKEKLLNSSPLHALAKTDSAWKSLVKENEMNAFVYQFLYEASSGKNEPTSFGLVLKSCDLSVETAKACGLYFSDKTAVPGQTYVYRISIPGTTHSAIINTDEKFSVLRAPEKIKGEFRNRKAAITFDVTTTRESAAGYVIERSEDSIHFERINYPLLSFARSQYETTKTELVYQDTFPQNHKTYWYRVRVYSYFGITGPPSETVKGKGREEWTLYPEADTIFSPDNKKVQLKWHVPENNSALTGFLVQRSSSADGVFSILTVTGKTIFQFIDLQPMNSNYYRIAAVSIYGDTAFSFPYFFGMTDSLPPAVPENISGAIDTNGVVHLSWNEVTATDLKGYRVFRSNTLKEEFVEVSDSILRDNFFIDTITLQTLTRNVYYEVRSVDRRYNNSGNSNPYLLKRPDKIPPVTPLVTSIRQTDSTICFSWINSSSDDIMCVELKEKNRVLGSWNGKDTIHSFTQTGLTPQTIYHYKLIVTDSSGNTATTDFPEVRFTPRICPALQNFTALPDREKRIIALSWEKPVGEIDRYIIYKSKKGEPLRSWKTIDGKSNSFTDKESYPGNVYTYKIKAVMRSGAETKLASVEVVY